MGRIGFTGFRPRISLSLNTNARLCSAGCEHSEASTPLMLFSQ